MTSKKRLKNLIRIVGPTAARHRDIIVQYNVGKEGPWDYLAINLKPHSPRLGGA